MDTIEIIKLVMQGGTPALALVVWYELREHRKELSAIGTKITAILERDRSREIKEFIREEVSGVHESETVTQIAAAVSDPASRRAPTPPLGVGIYGMIKRKGTEKP